MSTFHAISSVFRTANTSMKSRISSVLYEEGSSLLSDFQNRSPVDSGTYRSNWRLKKSRFTSASTFASLTIYNDTPLYGIFMEEGAERNQPPWNYPGVGKKRTGKLIVRNGRVWAGGISPGHAKTVRGAIGPALINNNRRLNQLTKNIADAVIGGFK